MCIILDNRKFDVYGYRRICVAASSGNTTLCTLPLRLENTPSACNVQLMILPVLKSQLSANTCGWRGNGFRFARSRQPCPGGLAGRKEKEEQFSRARSGLQHGMSRSQGDQTEGICLILVNIPSQRDELEYTEYESVTQDFFRLKRAAAPDGSACFAED